MSDHDYGCDNSDKTYPHKYETTNAFVDFIGEAEDSPLSKRAAAGKGVYGVKIFDFDRTNTILVPESKACIDPDMIDCIPSYSNKSVAIFVLDVRTNKDAWNSSSGDFLGEEQWEWFEGAMSKSRATVNVVVNGLQVNSNLFPNPNIAESWTSFPKAQQRLYDTVLGGALAPILVSGDVHMAQMIRTYCQNVRNPQQRRPLVEVTTSGMTHSWGRIHTPPINDKDGTWPSWVDYVVNFVGWTAMQTMHYILPWNHLANSDGAAYNGGIENAKRGIQYSLERNFGELEFDWEGRTVTIRVMGEDPNAPPLLASRISLDQLSGRTQVHTDLVAARDFELEVHKRQELRASKAEWTCVGHRGRVTTARELTGQALVVISLGFIFGIPIFLGLYLSLRLIRFKRRRSKSRPLTPVPPLVPLDKHDSFSDSGSIN